MRDVKYLFCTCFRTFQMFLKSLKCPKEQTWDIFPTLSAICYFFADISLLLQTAGFQSTLCIHSQKLTFLQLFPFNLPPQTVPQQPPQVGSWKSRRKIVLLIVFETFYIHLPAVNASPALLTPDNRDSREMKIHKHKQTFSDVTVKAGSCLFFKNCEILL